MVSRTFEEEKKAEIFGMQKFSENLSPLTRFEFIYSEGPNGAEPRSRSNSHGGCDNDVATMNGLLRSVLGLGDAEEPPRPFTREDLGY